MMHLALYTNIISPHQLPLARRLVQGVGAAQFRYVYRDEVEDRAQLGWASADTEGWITKDASACETAGTLLSGIRDVGLFERRTAKGLQTLYMSERWFKPGKGMWRLLSPWYLKMTWRIVRLIQTDPKFMYLPMGVHAATDMARLCGLFRGELRCLFCAPKLEFERVPGGEIHLFSQNTQGSQSGGWSVDEMRYGLDKMRLWGYFVEPSSWSDQKLKELRTRQREDVASGKRPLRVLWVGRMLDWKRVDTLIEAVVSLVKQGRNVSLDLVGYGPEEQRLRNLARNCPAISFHPPLAINRIRELMRDHDLYVLPSNGFEGWGAVVSEAMAERMPVFGTREAGCPATVLSERETFGSGDCYGLMGLIGHQSLVTDRERSIMWSVNEAAKCLLKIRVGHCL